MNRKHDREYYFSIIEKLKNVNKHIKISSDFIIGYPGETEKDFADTVELVEKVGFVNSLKNPRNLNNLVSNAMNYGCEKLITGYYSGERDCGGLGDLNCDFNSSLIISLFLLVFSILSYEKSYG